MGGAGAPLLSGSLTQLSAGRGWDVSIPAGLREEGGAVRGGRNVPGREPRAGGGGGRVSPEAGVAWGPPPGLPGPEGLGDSDSRSRWGR